MEVIRDVLLFLFLVGCGHGQTVSSGNGTTDCSHNKADIVFLLDSSYSEGSNNFQKQLDFVKNFTQGYTIGPDNVQVSVVTFATSTHNAFYLNQHQDKASLLTAIKQVRYQPGATYTGAALKYVRTNSFLPQHGGRYGVPQIIVVMTDGQSSDTATLKSETAVLKYTNIKVISIGIGSGVDMDELRSIASDNQHAFAVLSFDLLQSIETEIQSAACVSEKVETCDDKKADIVFVLDASSSEGPDNFRRQLEFVSNFTSKFPIGPNATQFSLVTFSTNTYNEFFLNQYHTAANIEAAIKAANFTGGTTHTEKALQFVRENSFKPENGGREGSVAKLVIVLTDGNSASPSSTKTQATLLHNIGAQVIAVGIGSSISQTELTNIATDARHTFAVASFDSLSTIQTQLETAACTTRNICGGKPTDIVFILDSSTSEGQAHFQKQLDFMADFVNHFDVGPSAVQFGLVTFSSTAHNEFYLNTYSDKYSLIAAIHATTYRPGTTATYEGLRRARYYEFTSSHGARQGAEHIVVLMTDGRSDDVTRTLSEAQSLKSNGVKVITIGIGDSVNQYELNNIATDRNHAFTVGSFDILHTIETDIRDESCGGDKPQPTPFPECGLNPTDIVFVLDSSASEGSVNFQKQLDFVRDFVYQFNIGPQALQVSVVVFSSGAHEQFQLDRYLNKTDLMAAIAKITYNSGATYTDKALQYVRLNSFLPSKGGRANATHLVVVITDGQSTRPAQTKTEAELLKNTTGATVIAIGIGSGVAHAELETIASDHNHAIAIANFDALQAVTSEITFVACKTCQFISKADIVFLLDASSSEGANNFQKQLDFVSRVVNDLQIGPTQVQVGVATFSDQPNLEFYLNMYPTKSQVLTQIQRITYMQGTTHTDLALTFAQSMFTPQHGARPDAGKYLIVLTDGVSADPTKTVQAANLLKQQGIVVLSIGIGSSIGTQELDGIASDSNHVFTVASFDALNTLRTDIAKAGCEEVMTTTTTTTTTTPQPTTTTTTPKPTTIVTSPPTTPTTEETEIFVEYTTTPTKPTTEETEIFIPDTTTEYFEVRRTTTRRP